MNQTKLAEVLVTANENKRQKLLTKHVELADIKLAWILKSLYDNVESSDPARAAKVSIALSSLTKVTTDIEVSAVAAWTEGVVILDEGHMDRAITYLETAETHFFALGLPARAAATQVSKLRALAMLGRFDEALECGLQARDVFLTHNDLLATGKIEQSLGNLQFLLDHYVKAEQHYRAAKELYEIVDDQKQLAQIDNCLATTLTSQHRFREAEMIYENALSRA